MSFGFNKRNLLVVFLVCCASIGWVGVSSADTEIFAVDFNDRTPGTYIGDGGASMGEPSNLSVLTGQIFQQSPGENYLEVLMDPPSTTAKSMHWEFLEGGEVTEGVVVISFQFTPTALDGYSFGIREAGGSARSFLTLKYLNNGTFYLTDNTGNITISQNQYTAGSTQNVVMTFDMDAGTSSMTINGSEIFSDQAHGITDHGVGKLTTGFNAGSNNSPFYLDDINITSSGASTLHLNADFESYTLGSALGLGGAEMDEPYTMANNLYTEVVAHGIGTNQALYLENGTGGGGQNASWHFYDDLEVTSGIVNIQYDLELHTTEKYKMNIREHGSSTINFSTIRFSNGNISYWDEAGYSLNVASYQLNQMYRIKLSYDLDNGTYTFTIDDQIVFENRSYGYSGETGVGKVILGFDSGSSEGDSMIIDNLQVTTGSDDVIFMNGFESSP